MKKINGMLSISIKDTWRRVRTHKHSGQVLMLTGTIFLLMGILVSFIFSH